MAEEKGRREVKEAIQPPKIEDAGLEDCALPIESIMEAFSRAASISLASRFTDQIDDQDGEDEEEEEIRSDMNREVSTDQEKRNEEEEEKGKCTGEEQPIVSTGEDPSKSL